MNRRFGVEIEATGIRKATLVNALRRAGLEANVTRYGLAATPYWKVTPDGSLAGVDPFEMVSPPLQGEFGMADLISALRILNANNAQVNRTCGFHVHIEADGFDLVKFKRLAKSYANNEDVFDAIMPQSRRDNRNYYSRSLIGLTPDMTDEQRVGAVKEFFAKVDACTEIRQIAYLLGDRYHKLNLLAYLEHGTVEFRHHAGTVNVQKVVNWVKFCEAFVSHAANARSIRPWGINKMTKTARLKTVLNMIGASDLYPFYRDRIKELRRDPEA